MTFPALLARSSRLSASVLTALLLTVSCAGPATPPPAVGGDDKPVKDPDELGKDGKKGPLFYTADAPPPEAGTTPGEGTPGAAGSGPVKLSSASVGQRSSKLLSPGAEPLEKRVYSPKVGAKETLTIATKTTASMAMGGQAVPGGDTGLPPTTLEIALTVKEVSDDRIKTAFVVNKASATAKTGGDDPVAKYVASVIALKGAKGTVTTTRGGDAVAVQIDEAGPDANRDLLRDQLLTPSAPFPVEPIGVGAKWEVRSPSADGGMRTEQITTYELVSLAKGKGKLGLGLRVTAPEQDIEVPGAPVSPHLTKLDGNGTGSISFELGKVAARSSSLTVSSKATVNVSMMGQDMAGEMSSRNETKRTGR